ncbi:MAG TPA: carboxymuconolactone decarboxylase family protein [Longimicrobiales bacterium]
MTASQRIDGLRLLAARRPGALQAYLAALNELGRSLDPATRQLILIALQVVQRSTRGLRRHVPEALAAGATPDAVIDAIALALPIAGLTPVTEALAAVADLLEAAPAGETKPEPAAAS